jgi:hypothetical protein
VVQVFSLRPSGLGSVVLTRPPVAERAGRGALRGFLPLAALSGGLFLGEGPQTRPSGASCKRKETMNTQLIQTSAYAALAKAQEPENST